MPISKDFLAEFEENSFYHVYTKSVGNNLLFHDSSDKNHYLQSYSILLNNFLETHAYNLLDNHVHFVVKIKSTADIVKYLHSFPPRFLTITQKKFLDGKCSLHSLLKQQFQRLAVTHTNYFNKVYNRKGNLFNRPFKRKLVLGDDYLTRLCVYVHANEVHHKIASTFQNCKWSSYNDILGDHDTNVNRDAVLNLFGGRENYILVHEELALSYSGFDFG